MLNILLKLNKYVFNYNFTIQAKLIYELLKYENIF